MILKRYDFLESQKYGANYAEFKSRGGRILSPSSMSKAVSNPHEWYLDFNGLNPNPFSGNEATIRGSVIHAAIEAYFLEHSIDYTEVENWIIDKTKYIPQLMGLQTLIVNETIKAVNIFKTEFNTSSFAEPKPRYTEKYMEFQITENIKLAGTADAMFLNNDSSTGGDSFTLVDWKTSKQMKKTMGDYKAQLYAYIILARKTGIDITRIGVCYIVHPTKTIPHRISYVEEKVDESYAREMELFIDNRVKALNLMEENPDVLTPEIMFPVNCFVGSYLASKPREFAAHVGTSLIK